MKQAGGELSEQASHQPNLGKQGTAEYKPWATQDQRESKKILGERIR